MMLILRDDRVLETFDSPANPPSWIESIDVENQEYEFCDDQGQRYVGSISRGQRLFSGPDYCLVPEGKPDQKNLEGLLNQAVAIEEADKFHSLAELRRHLSIDCS